MITLFTLLKGRIVVTVAVGALLLGGATAAFAATPAGQEVVQSLTHTHTPVTALATDDAHHAGMPDKDGSHGQAHTACPGMTEAQDLATSFHLSTSAQGAAVMAICALHAGTFKGMTAAGAPVASRRIFGYGEIDQLLTYAQFLAAHDATNVGGKLTDTNVSSFLTAALNNCGSTSLEICLKNAMPNTHPGNDNGNGNGNGSGNGNKPTMTPNPHH